MSIRRISNTVLGASNWSDEVETKNILKIGHFGLDFTDLDTAVPKVIAGSTVGINGVIYKYDTNEDITNITIANGTIWITIRDAGASIITEFTDVVLPTYDKIKKGYYGATGERYIAEIEKTTDDYSAIMLVDESYVANKEVSSVVDQVEANTVAVDENTIEIQSNTASIDGNNTLLWKVSGSIPETLESPNPKAHGYFGTSVATTDNLTVVGAYKEDGSGVDISGRVYIYNTVGVLQTTLESPNPKADGGFGRSVSISDSLIIVGAYKEGSSGKVYIYSTAGVLQTTLDSPNPEAYGYFGYSVAINNNLIVVGAYNEDGSGVDDSGRAYIYDTAGVLQATLDSPNPKAHGYFGYSVAINNNYIIVGAYGEDVSGISNSGRAYIYNTAGVLQTTLDSPNPKAYGYFGISISISNNLIVVGAYSEDVSGISNSGRAYIYDIAGVLQTTLESPNPEAHGGFGFSISISDSLIVVGANNEDVYSHSDAGRAYIYDIAGVLQTTLESPSPETPGVFGSSVEVGNSFVVIAAEKENFSALVNSGRVYIYNAVK